MGVEEISKPETRNPILMVTLFLVVALLSTPARAQNLLTNGNFTAGVNADGEPKGWHTRLVHIIAEPLSAAEQGAGPATQGAAPNNSHTAPKGDSQVASPVASKGASNSTVLCNYMCPCGYKWGTVRPWTMLVCPKCKGTVMDLVDTDAWYARNHESIVILDTPKGKVLGMHPGNDLKDSTGKPGGHLKDEPQGVRALSDLIPAEHRTGYTFSFDFLAHGMSAKVSIECFKEVPTDTEAANWVKTLPPECNPLHLKYRLMHSYALSDSSLSSDAWMHEGDKPIFCLLRHDKGNRAFDYICLSLFAEKRGEAGFANVKLRKVTPEEMADYEESSQAIRPGKKNRNAM
jgi:hypothetical protein